MKLSGLYLITDRRACGHLPLRQAVQAALSGGVRLIQYREKTLSKREAFLEAQDLRGLARQAGATFIVNDDADLAMAVEADGLHLGQDDLPLPVARKILGRRMIIGISARDIQAVSQAGREGADYVAVGPIFASPTKQVRPPLGPSVLREFRHAVRCPLFGIGGITPENACQVMEAGANGVAVVSAILGAPDVTAAVRNFIERLAKCGKPAKTS